METYYEVTATNAAGDSLFIGEESVNACQFVKVPDLVAEGGGVSVLLAYLLSVKSAPRWDDSKGRMVRNRVAAFRVRLPHTRGHSWTFERMKDGTLMDTSNGVIRPVVIKARPAFKVHGPTRSSTADVPGTPLVVKALSAPEPVKAPAPRTSAAESPKGPRVTVKTASGAERGNDTTPERLTVGSDNPKGEPVYVKTLPERHHVHPGRTVLDVFGHDGYWFTVPGNFPASLPEEFHLSRMTLAVFQSPDVVPGFLVWVVRQTTGAAPNLGTSAESRRAAVRSALARLSTSRMQRARRIVENRAAINSRPAPAPVRVSAGDAGWVVHVRCACEHLDDAENFPSVATAARQWINQDPGTPWELCAHSPRAFTSIAGISYTITGTGRGGTGGAVVNGMSDDGHPTCLSLADARPNSL